MTKHSRCFVGAVFDNPGDAHALVEQMIKHDFPMDQVSILHKAGERVAFETQPADGHDVLCQAICRYDLVACA